MKRLVAALMVVVAPTMAFSAEKWQTYANDKYKYEVQYPDSYELIVTGPKNDRDGKTVRIALKEITRLHGIDIEIHPGMSLEQIMSKIKAPRPDEIESGNVTIDTKLHKITWRKTTTKNVPAVQMQARSAENGHLLLTSLIMDRVVITAHLWPEGGLDEEFVERIISTFKWKTKTHNKPDAGDGK